MGALNRFCLKAIKKKGITHLIETGAWYGDSINYAVDNGFSVQSCEVNDKYFMIAENRFRHNEDVEIYQLPSDKFIAISNDRPAVYWLDAHLPDLYAYHEENQYSPEQISYPLKSELELMATREHFKNSVIIIDDLRLYHKGEYQAGAVTEEFFYPSFDPAEWFAEFGMHDVFLLHSDEGYLVALPKEWRGAPADIDRPLL